MTDQSKQITPPMSIDDVPDISPLPSAENPPITRRSTKMPPGDYLKEKGKQLSHRVYSEWKGGIVGFILLTIVVVAVIFYALNGKPLFSIDTDPLLMSPQPQTQETHPSIFTESAFVILGEYNGEIYTFNKGVKKVYAYSSTDYKERQVCKLTELDAFWWHKSGKISILSHTHNTLGSIYILDLTQNPPERILITDRESNPYFPRTLSVEISLPMVWAEAGDAIAFVARDVRNNMESLFIFDMTSRKLIYTPARNLERISSVVWVDGDKHLALVAISDGQESRYLVERLGGGFAVWNIID